jgi:TP901 family phage tail tape measure protein
MAVGRSLSIKFGTEGFAQAVSEMQRVAKSFDTALAASQKAVQEANLNVLRGTVMGSAKRVEEAEKARSKAARDANQIISNSYRELKLKSERDLNTQRQQAISAYNAIRASGVASARDIDRANLGLRERLGQIDQALELTSSKAKGMGRNLTEAVQAAKNAIRGADLTLNQADRAGSKTLARSAKDARERATWRLERGSESAFSRLGVTSEANIHRQRREAVDAYNAIRASGVASARDIARAEKALNQEFKELDRTLHGTQGLLDRLSTSATEGLKGLAGNLTQGVGQSIGFSAINALSSAAAAPFTLSVSAVSKWADFETQLKAIKVAAEGADITPLRREIETLGPELGKLPSELANVAIELTRAGFSADQTAKLLRGVGYTSQATGEDLSIAGDIVRNTIKQFQVGTEDYNKVADILVAGANKTSAGVATLGESLSYVGPNAALANQSLVDTVTILGALADAGLQGSMSGTNFSEALQRLKIASAGASTETVVTTRGMKTASEAINELGVEFRNADGSMRPILDTLPELRKALKALPQTDQDVIMRVLFGEQGGRAINALLVKTDSQLATLRKSIEQSGGAAKAAGKEMTSGLGGSLQRLQATFEVGLTALGEAEAPGIQAATNTVGELITKLLAADGVFGELNTQSQDFADFLHANPEMVEALNKQVQALARVLIADAAEAAKQLLAYLKENPDALVKAAKSAESFFAVLGKIESMAGRILDPIGKVLNATASAWEIVNKPLNPNSWLNGLASLGDLKKIGFNGLGGVITSYLPGLQGNLGSKPSGAGQKVYPVQGGQYVGGGGAFGADRNYGAHTGEDITGQAGTRVSAVMSGVVESIKKLDGAAQSYSVTVKAADGTLQRYKHITPSIGPGQAIAAGDQIGVVAQKDALSTGPHLHYEVERNGGFVDPKVYLTNSVQKTNVTAAASNAGSSSAIALPRQAAAPPRPGVAATGATAKPIIRVTRTGSKSAQGLEILQMDLVQNGSVKDSILVTSGRAANQTFSTAANSARGRKTAPIPEGEYGVNKLEQGSFGPSIGSTWVGLNNITPNQRGGFGIHLDNDFAIKPGSEGCLVLGDKSAIAKLKNWMNESDPTKLIVDYGFGTVADPTKLTKTEIKKTLEDQTKAAQAQRNQYQYLARIAEGESSGGKNIGPNPQTGAYGEYQFTPDTRSLLMKQAPNLDPWSKNKGTRDQSALKWIELYGQEIGVDILTMIRKGEFEAVDKLLGQKGPSGFAQFSSLPGGTEASPIWQDPAKLRKFAPIGEVKGDVYYQQAEDAKAEAEKKARELIEKARKRTDERTKQQQDINKKRLEDSQKKALTDFDLQTSKLPEGEAKAARGIERTKLERDQQNARDRLETEQTLNQLLEERKQKLADIEALKKNPDAKIDVTGRDITAEIAALNERKKILEETYRAETQIAQNNTAAELAQRGKDLDKSVTDINKSVTDLKLQYADTSPETREAQAIAQVNEEFASYKASIVEAIKATLDLITAKQAQGQATNSEIATLELLKSKYLEVQAVQNKQLKKSAIDTGLAERQRSLDQQKAVGDIDSQIAEAKASRLDKYGVVSDEANHLREQAAIAQEGLRYKQQLLDLDSTYKDQPQLLTELKQKASELNQLNLSNVKDQFKSLGETIQDAAANSLTQFFTDIFSGTKTAKQAFRDMALSILKTIGQMASQMLASSVLKSFGGLFGKSGGGGFFSNLFGGGGGGGFSLSSLGALPSFHDGGHTGGGGEFLAKLRGGEFVLSPTATDFFGHETLSRMNTLSPVPDRSSSGSRQSGGNQTISINVSAPDANSFNRSEMQIGSIAAEQLARARRRNS